VIATVLESGPVTPRRAEPALRGLVAALPILAGSAPLDGFDALLDPVLDASKASGVDALLLVRVMAARGVLRRHRGRAREGADDLVRALAIVRASNSAEKTAVEGEILRELGWALFAANKMDEARDHFARALAIAESTGDLVAQGRALGGEATLHHTMLELDQAAALLERAVALQGGESADDLHGLGAVRRDQGRHAESKQALEHARAIATAQGDRRQVAAVQSSFGLLALDTGDLDAARAALGEAASVFGDLGARRSQGVALGLLGILARMTGKSADAWTLLRQAVQQVGESDFEVIFGAHLAALDVAAGRVEQSQATLEALSKRDVRPVAAAILSHGNVSSAIVRVTERCAKGTARLPPDDALVIAADGTWFRMPGGERVPLDRRRPLARMLAAMARGPGASFTSAALLTAGWPSEKVLAAAGAHRVRVGIATLRKLGLRDAIKTTEDGYTLSQSQPVAVVE
jgi:tetratricopeptide (TPR) repeat protein